MAIIQSIRLPNTGDASLILQRVDQVADGDICYLIYPSAGVTRFGVGNALFQFFKGDATNVVVQASICGLDAINNYLKDRALVSPKGIAEPKFVTLDTLTADTLKQYISPFTVMKITFNGVGTSKAFAILGVS